MGRDKALLPYHDSTFLASLVDVFLGPLCPVVVVLGHHADQLRAAAGGAQVVVNEDYDRGMLSSLQTGLRALPGDLDGVAFTLVDHPGLRVETLSRLVEAFEASGKPLVLPTYRGERGHPALIAPRLVEELLALPPDGSPKPVLRAYYSEAEFVAVEDPSVVADIDRPEDLARLSSGADPDACAEAD
jgi:CTP:molybdopterin cytidylyltransferase MocA